VVLQVRSLHVHQEFLQVHWVLRVLAVLVVHLDQSSLVLPVLQQFQVLLAVLVVRQVQQDHGVQLFQQVQRVQVILKSKAYVYVFVVKWWMLM
jgi:hypothetical protein